MAGKKSSPKILAALKPKKRRASAPAAAKPTRAPAKNGAAGSTKAPARKPTTNRSSAKPAAPRVTRQPARPKADVPPIRPGLSLDRKLDIIGMVLTLVGLLTLLSLLSSRNSEVIGWWVTGLARAFGYGRLLFPFGMILLGLWLLLRSFERIPQLAIERLAGIVLLFFVLLGWFHFVPMAFAGHPAVGLAEAGLGGGYGGAFLTGLLDTTLGIGGAAVVLGALTLVALALALDITIMEMARWLHEHYMQFLDWAADTIDDWQNRRAGSPPATAYPPAEYTSTAYPSAVLQTPTDNPPPTIPHLPAPNTGDGPVVALGVRGQGAAAPVWRLPPVEQVLDVGGETVYDDEIDAERARTIEETLGSFGAPAKVVEINRGPTITQFGVEPDFIESRSGRMRVRVGKIAALADDLALALSARTIRVQAPVPGKGFVGIEVPNDEVALVALRDLIESESMKRLKSPLRFALGQNVSGNAVAADLAAMPHLLIAGATGSGKSVAVNALISCLLINNSPNELRLVMVDPKRVELTGYNGIPHLLAPVVVDLEKVVTVLQWVTREMDMRYRKLAEVGCRNIQEFNRKQPAQKLPFLVVIIDELADLMMLAPEETERAITRLAQLARATGIHLVIATQRPSVDVVTGLIKANFPARIAFAVASNVDSRTILDQPGAERLLGRGDMLFQAPDAPAPVRLQGVYVSDSEIGRLVDFWRSQAGVAQAPPSVAGGIVDSAPSGVPLKQMPLWEEMEAEEDGDPLMNEAIDLARRQGRASISMLQRRLRIGYTRAARLIETMEAKGIIGPPEPGSGARQVLDYGPAAPPVDEA